MNKRRVFAVYRERKGYSQAELANLLGVKQQAVSSWELGRTFPKPYQLQQIAEILEFSKDELFSDMFQIKEEE